MRLLELFSGTGSVGAPWREAGHEVIAIDIDGRYNPEICEDILQLSFCKLPIPDVIWASVPREQYSRARTTGRRPRNFELADSLVGRAWEIIQYFLKLNPTFATGRGQRQVFFEAVRQLRAFRKAYRDAMAQWVQGHREVVFPAGTLQMHTLHQVRVAPS